MADHYLERLEEVFKQGVRDLHEAAARLELSFETVCNTFNNGLLKGYWRIVVTDKPDLRHLGMSKEELGRQ
ncbi:MAG TPA: hypothetical protein VKW06_00710 [Candidatus Angelobacter sp.]|nr:hypothetical protein [Candidatus Angelobacter sp.]